MEQFEALVRACHSAGPNLYAVQAAYHDLMGEAQHEQTAPTKGSYT